MNKVTQLNVKPDRLANEELWQIVEKYQSLGLIDPLIRGMFHDVAFELQMGPAVFVEDGDEPA